MIGIKSVVEAVGMAVGGVAMGAALTLGLSHGVVVGLLSDDEARAAARDRHPAGKGRQQSMADARRISDPAAEGRGELPDTQLVNGLTRTTHIADPCWLFVSMITDEDGYSSWSVYRSTWLREDSKKLRRVRALIGDATLVRQEVIKDETMMHGAGVLSMYVVDSRGCTPR